LSLHTQHTAPTSRLHSGLRFEGIGETFPSVTTFHASFNRSARSRPPHIPPPFLPSSPTSPPSPSPPSALPAAAAPPCVSRPLPLSPPVRSQPDYGIRCQIQGIKLWIPGVCIKVLGVGFRDWGFNFRVRIQGLKTAKTSSLELFRWTTASALSPTYVRIGCRVSIGTGVPRS